MAVTHGILMSGGAIGSIGKLLTINKVEGQRRFRVYKYKSRSGERKAIQISNSIVFKYKTEQTKECFRRLLNNEIEFFAERMNAVHYGVDIYFYEPDRASKRLMYSALYRIEN